MFIATTNEDEFLDGARQHRRWLPVVVQRNADTVLITRDRKQLWAEARMRFEADGLLFAKAEKLGALHREEFRIRDVWEDLIAEWLHTPDDMDEKRAKPSDAAQIHLVDVARFALGLDPKNLKRGDEIKIANALKAVGYESKRVWDPVEGRQMRVWEKKNAAG